MFRFLARSPDPICPRGGDPGSTGHLKALAHGGNLSPCRERAGSMLSVIRFWYLRLEDFDRIFQIAFDSDFWVAVAMAF